MDRRRCLRSSFTIFGLYSFGSDTLGEDDDDDNGVDDRGNDDESLMMLVMMMRMIPSAQRRISSAEGFLRDASPLPEPSVSYSSLSYFSLSYFSLSYSPSLSSSYLLS